MRKKVEAVATYIQTEEATYLGISLRVGVNYRTLAKWCHDEQIVQAASRKLEISFGETKEIIKRRAREALQNGRKQFNPPPVVINSKPLFPFKR